MELFLAGCVQTINKRDVILLKNGGENCRGRFIQILLMPQAVRLGINNDAQICSHAVFWLRRFAPCFSRRADNLRGFLTRRPFCFQGWHSDVRVGLSRHPFASLHHATKNILDGLPRGFSVLGVSKPLHTREQDVERNSAIRLKSSANIFSNCFHESTDIESRLCRSYLHNRKLHEMSAWRNGRLMPCLFRPCSPALFSGLRIYQLMVAD